MAVESNIGDTNDLGLHADMIACAMDVQCFSFDFTLLVCRVRGLCAVLQHSYQMVK